MTVTTAGAVGRGRQVRVVAGAATSMLVAAWPPFLVSVLATELDGLGASPATAGLGMTAFFTAAALSSGIGGRCVDRLGPTVALRIVGLVTFLVCLGIAAATSIVQVLALLAVVGVVNGLVQPATGLAVRSGIPVHRHGLAMGVVQASIPATLVGSAALLPVVSAGAGWRAAFLVAAGCAAVSVLLVPRTMAGSRSLGVPSSPAAVGAQRVQRSTYVLALAAFCGAGAASAVATYASATGMAVGLGTAVTAGWIAVAGLACAVCRVIVGWWSGRSAAGPSSSGRGVVGRGLLVMTFLFTAGAAGLVGLGSGSADAFGPALVLAYGLGWAWTGVLGLVVLRSTTSPARALGVTQTGVFGGSALGPVAHVALATGISPPTAWWVFAASSGLAAVLVLLRLRAGSRPVHPL